MVALASVGYIFKASISEGGLAVVKSFKAAEARVADNIKGVNGRDLRRRLITYELKGPSVLMNSLISLSDYSVRLSS